MRVGMFLNYAGGFREAVDEVAELERAGLDLIAVPEAYSFDAVSQLGYIAASTSKVKLASGILQMYTRTPSLTAMTAAGLDFVSGGRFMLGIGASGPQVIEGFHGVKLRRAARPHARDHRDLPPGLAARAGGATRAATTRSRCPRARAPAWASR